MRILKTKYRRKKIKNHHDKPTAVDRITSSSWKRSESRGGEMFYSPNYPEPYASEYCRQFDDAKSFVDFLEFMEKQMKKRWCIDFGIIYSKRQHLCQEFEEVLDGTFWYSFGKNSQIAANPQYDYYWGKPRAIWGEWWIDLFSEP